MIATQIPVAQTVATKLAAALERSELEIFARTDSARAVFDAVVRWFGNTDSYEAELESARTELARLTTQAATAADARDRHEKDRKARARDEWKWGQKRSELLEAAEKAADRVQLETAHIAAVKAALEHEREQGPLI